MYFNFLPPSLLQFFTHILHLHITVQYIIFALVFHWSFIMFVFFSTSLNMWNINSCFNDFACSSTQSGASFTLREYLEIFWMSIWGKGSYI